MRQTVTLAMLALLMSGCVTTTPAPYGNQLPATGPSQDRLADDVLTQLVKLYPPAHVRFELQQLATDGFGASLLKGLRERGYAVLEFDPRSASSKAASTAVMAAQGSSGATPVPGSQALPLRYLLDQAGSPDLYRLTLMIGNQSLTRAYLPQDGVLLPAGYWARQE